MDAVTVDAGGRAPLRKTGIEKKITRVVSVGDVVVGSLRSARDLIECEIVMPNSQAKRRWQAVE
jgi:hypothetical protein